MNHLWRWKDPTIPGPGILNYSLVGLNLCRSRHLRIRDGVGMPHARSGGDALIECPNYQFDPFVGVKKRSLAQCKSK
jgi:hypothetical protein